MVLIVIKPLSFKGRRFARCYAAYFSRTLTFNLDRNLFSKHSWPLTIQINRASRVTAIILFKKEH